MNTSSHVYYILVLTSTSTGTFILKYGTLNRKLMALLGTVFTNGAAAEILCSLVYM